MASTLPFHDSRTAFAAPTRATAGDPAIADRGASRTRGCPSVPVRGAGMRDAPRLTGFRLWPRGEA
jgi:hypothetical protein